ncbi:hypothetical protein ABZ071_27395, partial [Micromonospora fulviviridis]
SEGPYLHQSRSTALEKAPTSTCAPLLLRSWHTDITNVALQDVCPADLASEHLAVGTYDAVAYALALDALDHHGPASPARIDPAVCGKLFMPGVDPVRFAANYAALGAVIAQQLTLAPKSPHGEPELKPYTLRQG